MKYVQYPDFTLSLRELHQKGGPYQRAAQTVRAAWGQAHLGASYEEVFKGIAVTNNGENRLPHCVKYDLTGHARLVTVVNNGMCMFLFAGDHNAVDRWLDKNRGMDFIARHDRAGIVVEPVQVSVSAPSSDGLFRTDTDFAMGPLVNLLSERQIRPLTENLDGDLVEDIVSIESVASDDDILNLALRIANSEQSKLVFDVLLQLRAGDVLAAKARIDLYRNEAKKVAELDSNEVAAIHSGEKVVNVSDIDPELFDHFVRTASFHTWMLYLHPDQRVFAKKDYNGPARLAGVSGSGKTCVVIHRALWLSEKYPDENILILTLNSALARLINDLIDSARGEKRPKNLKVRAFWEFCREKLLESEPDRAAWLTRQTIVPNPHAVSEHIDEIWSEYYQCENNNHDADKMFPLHRSLLLRGVYPQDYIRQEFDYVRSALAPEERQTYIDMDRAGRFIPLPENYRQQILEGLAGWERKMEAVGAIDDIGIVSALYKHIDKLRTEYRCVLVDEVQDFGTLELKLIRKIVCEAENDLFLAGDAAQSVYTKRHDAREAGIELHGRYESLKRNYRNSRQILDAAHSVLTRNFDSNSKSLVDLEILSPEFANFSSPSPLLLKANTLLDEIRHALGYVDWAIAEKGSSQKICLAICGYTQRSIEILGERLGFPVLSGHSDLSAGNVFLSDLEQTKGFEFDSMLILNCTAKTMPHPDLPKEESFRDLCKLYVAMTRAKLELILTYSGEVSPFVAAAGDKFTMASFSDYAEAKTVPNLSLPPPALAEEVDRSMWFVSGDKFLKLRDAVGLPDNVQQEILDHVTGVERTRGQSGKSRLQTEWKTFMRFFETMKSGIRARHLIISETAWDVLQQKFAQMESEENIRI